MTGVLKTYNFNEVQVIVGGVPATGLAEGDDVVQVVQDADAWTLVVGADGEGTRSKSNNRAAKITLRVMQSSDLNDSLTGFYLADEQNGSGKFPVMIKDSNGRSLHVVEQAWVMKLPDSSYGANATSRDWVLQCASINSFIGGN